MKRRERILAAVEHRESDTIPFGFKGTDDVLDNLQKHFGVKSFVELLDVLPVDMYGCFNNCRYGVYPEYVGGPPKVLYPESYPDQTWDTIYGYKRHWVAGGGGRTDEVLTFPLAGASTVTEADKYEWPRPDWFDYRSLPAQCESIGDYARIFHLGGLGHVANLIGFERLLTDMLLNPAFIEACFENLTRFYVEFLDQVLKEANRGIDMICVQDDFGTQNGPLISMDLYRQFYKPYHKRIFEVAHQHHVKVMMHSCGAVFDFIPEFIAIGADILDPLQTNAFGMDPARLKKEFGSSLCFHGGIDTQETLVRCSPCEISRHIDGLINAFARDGGYILAPSHYIQTDVPLENIIAMLDYVDQLRM